MSIEEHRMSEQQLAADKAQNRAASLLRVYWLYVFLSAIGGYIIGYAASATTTVGAGLFDSSTTTHSVGTALSAAIGALLFAAFSGLPLCGIAWLLETQVVLLGGTTTKREAPTDHPAPSRGPIEPKKNDGWS